jgi:hypothetical protein
LWVAMHSLLRRQKRQERQQLAGASHSEAWRPGQSLAFSMQPHRSLRAEIQVFARLKYASRGLT